MKSELLPTKEQLQKQLNAIEKQEEKLMIEQNYPLLKKRFEGKYFKTRNGYNAKERWWMYTKITEIKPSDVYDTRGNGITSHFKGWDFQTSTSREITIEQVKSGYVHSLGQEITEKEFYEAYNKMIDSMDKLP